MVLGQRPERHLRSILSLTQGIVFLSTPHHGAGLARWAEILAKSVGIMKQINPQIIQVLRQDYEVLAWVQDSFHIII